MRISEILKSETEVLTSTRTYNNLEMLRFSGTLLSKLRKIKSNRPNIEVKDL